MAALIESTGATVSESLVGRNSELDRWVWGYPLGVDT